VENNSVNVEELIKKLLNENDSEKIKDIVEDIHPVDFLEILEKFEDEFYEIIDKLPNDYLVELINEAEIEDKLEIVNKISEDRKDIVIPDISSDELVDMLEEADEVQKKDIFEHLDEDDKDDIKELLEYPSDTAGGIMATEFLAIDEDMTMDETIAFLRKSAPDYETPYYLYVVGKGNILKGVVQLRQIITCDSNVKIKDEMITQVISVDAYTDQEEVANLFEKYGFVAIPVTNKETNEILGIITFDDIMAIISEEHTEDMYRMAGLDEEEEIDRGIISSVRSRSMWLSINLLTAFLASSVVGIFEGTISQVVALATFMPIVSGMGGNAATQTLTIMIRGIATGELRYENRKKVLKKELTVAIIDGILIGILIITITYIIVRNITFALIAGVALLLNILISAIGGFFVPLILKKLKIDPAIASSVFVTTMTDMAGFGIFLGLATVFMEHIK
jgi:magnesium transporter